MTPVMSSDTSGEEQVVRLNPFEVSTSRDVGYQATETLAGTRIRTNLADVSASISVVTKEFLDDIGAIDSSTLLNYTTNTQVAGPQGTYAGVNHGATSTSPATSAPRRAPNASADWPRPTTPATTTSRTSRGTRSTWTASTSCADRTRSCTASAARPASSMRRRGTRSSTIAARCRRAPAPGAARGSPSTSTSSSSTTCSRSGWTACGTTRNTSSSRPSKTRSGSTARCALTRSSSRTAPSTPASR